MTNESASPARASDAAKPYRAKRRWLFLPFILFGLLAAAYSAVWFKAKDSALQALSQWVAAEKARGIDAGFSQARVVGYPLRFAVEIADLRRADPLTGKSWTASWLRVNALPYDFQHIIVESLGPQTFVFSDKRVWTLNAKIALASLHWSKNGLVRLSADAKDLAWTSADGASGALKAWALQAQPDSADAELIKFESEAVDGRVPPLPEELSAFGSSFSSVKAKGVITQARAFADGLSPGAMDMWSARKGMVRFDDATLLWGAAQLTGKGTMALDGLRRPSGRIDFFAKDIEAVAQSLVTQGWIRGPASLLFLRGAREAQARDGGLKMDLLAQDGALSLWGMPVMELKPLYSPAAPDAAEAPVAGG